MHIPAMDSLRHERMGIITSEDNEIIMLVQDYVQTEDTDEFGTNEPLESFSRPFPYLATTSGHTVYPEKFIQNNSLEAISENVIEYASYLYESMEKGEWVDEIEKYDDTYFNDVEHEIASGLLTYTTTNHPPQTLYRMMYESAHKYMDKKYDNESTLFNNPLTDIDGRERYPFEYLPAIDEVDSWELKHYHKDTVTDEDIHVHAESLWLRYTIGDTTEERPLIIMKNSDSACMALSPNVDYGDGDENEAPVELVAEIINEDTRYDSALVTGDLSEIKGTRTIEYLENYLKD